MLAGDASPVTPGSAASVLDILTNHVGDSTETGDVRLAFSGVEDPVVSGVLTHFYIRMISGVSSMSM